MGMCLDKNMWQWGHVVAPWSKQDSAALSKSVWSSVQWVSTAGPEATWDAWNSSLRSMPSPDPRRHYWLRKLCVPWQLQYPGCTTAVVPAELASYQGPHAECRSGPGDTWQNCCICWGQQSWFRLGESRLSIANYCVVITFFTARKYRKKPSRLTSGRSLARTFYLAIANSYLPHEFKCIQVRNVIA